MSTLITSAHNPKLKQLRKLHDRKHRDSSGLFLTEGEDMLEEALKRGTWPRALFHDAERITPADRLLSGLPADVDVVPVEAEVLASASALGSGSRVIGVWEQRWSEIDPGGFEVAVYLHEISDPGNVGAVLRSAFGLAPSIVVLSPRSADPFGPKAVRASMGAVFGQPVARAGFAQARSALGGSWRAIALVPGAGVALRALEPAGRTLFALGSERSGLPAEIVSRCDQTAHVPLRADGAESLNVAMTATLCLYESAVHRLSETRGQSLHSGR